jgi:fermentation-respiration switch protein FrsA (DUF1100 family)
LGNRSRKFRGALLRPVRWPHLLLLIFLFIIFFMIFYTKIENFFVFYPQASFDSTPEELRLNYRDIYFSSEDGTALHGWFFPLKTKEPVILFCHGNAGNISHRLDNIRLFLERNLQVFLFDYRGYGKSSGSPSEEGIYQDGRAAYDYLVHQEHIPPDNVVLFGRSLGAAVAIDLALRRDIRAIIIESAFTSMKDMAGTLFLFNLFSSVLPANYNNLGKIGHIKVPKLIVHGEEDNLVPFRMGRDLFEKANDPKSFFPIRGAGHNDTYMMGGDLYFRAIVNFIKDSKSS